MPANANLRQGGSSQPQNSAELPERIAQILFDDKQAAEYIGGVTARAIRDWRSRRGLPFIRITGQISRIRKSDLDAWLAQRRVAITRRSAD